MKSEHFYLGIDVGSIAISVALLDSNKKVIQTAYESHEGQIAERLQEMLFTFPLSEVQHVATTSSTPKYIKYSASYDSRIAYITATKALNDRVGSILIVGGEKFGLVLFDAKGQYRKYKSNSSCAAGTGSFLDQQAKRLNLKSISEFSELAYHNTGEFPKIASRCSVFAKTDLIHAQQEGYSLSEICDGLCFGLAKNISDTLFDSGIIQQPLLFAGGVSQNRAVAKHIETLVGIKPTVSADSHLYGAIGVAICMMDEQISLESFTVKKPEDLVLVDHKEKDYAYKPLQLELSDYPTFASEEKYHFSSQIMQGAPHVEVDIYKALPSSCKIYIGIDIGSTSTKAMLLGEDNTVLAGFYTRTSGQPVIATRCIFEAIEDIKEKKQIDITILGAGTTGSGRKFIGNIIGADVIPDEISAHARAAIEIDKDVDTIIEIGGQDAKFTTLSNGRVTFSIMNNVCAAGTGSFIEEQAKKLGVSLAEYSDRAENTPAPMTSDRCTVFMERDLNHFISENYKTNEILASVLHSVRENYLQKVAIEKNIGEKIFFQGATAKNRALVAAFEQKLQKPIMISEYCHLTGAYGVALELSDMRLSETKFRGLDLCKIDIPVRTEVCDLCTNHCKYKIAEVDGETEVYGFMCGRDYNSETYVNNNTSEFNLIKEYNKQFRFKPETARKEGITIGIPSGLYMFEDMFLWQRFFDILGVKTITSTTYRTALKDGKTISGAEFCAPMTAMQGHVMHLLKKADYVFLPTYLEDKKKIKNNRRHYCYYTQFLPPVVRAIPEVERLNTVINPLLYSQQSDASFNKELYTSLHNAGLKNISLSSVSKAYVQAKKEHEAKQQSWKNVFNTVSATDDSLKVVLLGRPYTVMSPEMNSNIPELFAKNGVKTFFQDMLDVDENEVESLREVLDATKWKFAAKILSTAEKIARTKDLYPVFVTSFKCSPDSFVIEYFKQVLDLYKKPYLILQLDEYDSNVGYETRIEAALRSFNNHFHTTKKEDETVKELSYNNLITNPEELKGKTLLMPLLSEYGSILLEANLRRNGINAHTLFDTEDAIKRSLMSNSGQCLPMNIILQNAFDYIKEHNLDPANTVLWMAHSPVSCNLSMFMNYMSKQLFERSDSYNKVRLYTGTLAFADLSIGIALNTYVSFMFGGYIRKIECKLRPYEVNKGQTDAVVKRSLDYLAKVFEDGSSKEKALQKVIAWFKEIEVQPGKRPQVAIFGDMYARDNDVFNQQLIRFIEDNGGEAITTPYSEYVKMITLPYNKRLVKEGAYKMAALRRVLLLISSFIDRKYLKYFNEILQEPIVEPLAVYKEKLDTFGIDVLHTGESLDNVLKIFHLKEMYPDISLFVQTNPSYCCPSLVSEAMAPKMEALTGVPIITLEYDGTSAGKNEDIIPFIKFAKTKESVVEV